MRRTLPKDYTPGSWRVRREFLRVPDAFPPPPFKDAESAGDAASDAGITNAILYTTKSYRDHNLSGVTFECNLTGCDLSTQNLSAARFQTSDVSGADFTDAVVTRCDFSGAKGLTREQIESTWNYKMGNMAGIKLPKELEELAAANTTESAR